MDNIEAKKILFNIQQSNIKTWDAEVLEALGLAVKALGDIEDCRNELCLKCGSYKEAHLGACDGCRWRSTNRLGEYTPLPNLNGAKRNGSRFITTATKPTRCGIGVR